MKSGKTLFSERIKQRARLCGKHIAETGDTVRATAKLIGCSKSTVHKDINERLVFFNKTLYNRARKKMEKNLAERHIRGGIATKKAYEKAYNEAN